MGSESFTLQNCMDSLLAAAIYAKEQFPQVQEHCLFATGFGAYVTLLCLPRLQALAGRVRLVLQTPSVCMHETLLSMIRVSRQTLWAMESYTLPLPRPLEITYGFYESLLQNSAMVSSSQPMLILQGERDEYIRREDMQNFRRLNENARVVTLPGVGRKSANLILGDVYNVPGSTVVDTHCIRLSNRMGLVDNLKDPVRIEMALRKIIPPEKSSDFCHRIVLHGRAVCPARTPVCEKCCCAPWCQTANP